MWSTSFIVRCGFRHIWPKIILIAQTVHVNLHWQQCSDSCLIELKSILYIHLLHHEEESHTGSIAMWDWISTNMKIHFDDASCIIIPWIILFVLCKQCGEWLELFREGYALLLGETFSVLPTHQSLIYSLSVLYKLCLLSESHTIHPLSSRWQLNYEVILIPALWASCGWYFEAYRLYLIWFGMEI